MNETILLKPASPAPAVGVSPKSERLSTECLEQAGRRLRLFSAIVAGIVFFVLLQDHVLVYVVGWGAPHEFERLRLIQAGLVLLSLGVWVLGRSGWLRPRSLLYVGLVYEVVGAFLVALQSWVNGTLVQDQLLVISWLCVWIVMFPLIVPMTPGKNIVASFASATTAPLLLLCCLAMGHPAPPAQKLVASFLPNYMSAAMAIVPAYLIYKLNTSVSAGEKKIREMGSYQLVKLLGKGGMGEVWQAEHRMIARPAAIKIVHPNALEEGTPEDRASLLRRFEQEARATAALHSPHTVSLYDFGTTEDGTFYYAMELLVGLDLDSLVARFGPVPPARAAFILRQICDSLAEAHHSGMIHRDIKPANIYLCRLGLEHDFVKVLDFGLVAKAKGCQREKAAQITAANSIVGTPHYMSPEMAEGNMEIDGRADIYAVGCVGYWLLTGALVFDEDTPMKILLSHIRKPPMRPSERLGREIPRQLEDLVLQCLEKDPRNRPLNALGLSRSLHACPLPDRWTEYDAREWWKQNLSDMAAKNVETASVPTTVLKAHA
ncbi:serine/threonine protein kinase [bacterium]|nr:serine/threonine protein kinase [bacterium]